ncbi:MAG: AMP-dependent synthetase/ligase [Myxococcota bacterium]
MNAMETFFAQLEQRVDVPVVVEVHDTHEDVFTGQRLLDLAQRARSAFRAQGLTPGSRVALLGPNSGKWVACDLALMAEGLISVPLYTRQAPQELVGMLKDCDAGILLAPDSETLELASGSGITGLTYAQVFGEAPLAETSRHAWSAEDTVTLVYTSGTSGEPKGAMLTMKGLDFMLPRTRDALQSIVGDLGDDERVFHYLPFCFAGSRIVLWTSLFRGVPLSMSTSLDRLIKEIPKAAPHYFLNVPTLLERIRAGADARMRTRGAAVEYLYNAAIKAWATPRNTRSVTDRLALRCADALLFAFVRKALGPNLRFLICGSAPLSAETQAWFEMLQIPVYQVYGLTETTAIVTIDRVHEAEAGRVGHAIDGVELRLGDSDELQVHGANIFGGYWERPEASAQAFTADGWFRTGDQCELREDGSLKVIGRVKNVLVPSSGHNVPPEPIEQKVTEAIPGIARSVLIGHGRKHLTVLLEGEASATDIDRGLAAVNETLPFYKRVRAWRLLPAELESTEGLLTANGKLRRSVIATHYSDLIEGMYA